MKNYHSRRRKRPYTQEEILQDERLLRRVWDKEVVPNANRLLTKGEKEQRACGICEHSSAISLEREKRLECQKNERMMVCAFDHCPFHEMDKYEKYGDYCKETRRATEAVIGKAFGEKIKKAMERLGDEEEKAYKPQFRQLTDRELWEIGVRSSQGYDEQHIATEFNITEVQARLESKLYKRRFVQ